MPLRLQKPNLPAAVYWFTLLAFVLRMIARLHTGAADFWVNGYTFFFDMAQSIAAGKGIAIEGIRTASRVPFYPIFLAAVTLGHEAFWPIVIAQSMIGAATAFCAALLARQMFHGPWAAKAATLAAAITAVYPYYVVHDTALQETALFTLLTLMAVILAHRIVQHRNIFVGCSLWIAAWLGRADTCADCTIRIARPGVADLEKAPAPGSSFAMRVASCFNCFPLDLAMLQVNRTCFAYN